MASKTDTTILAVAAVSGYRQATAAEVKAWGENNGFTVNAGRGRMPLDLVHAFNAEHGKGRGKRAQYVTGSKVAEATEFAYTTAKGRAGKFTATVPAIRAWAQENDVEVGKRGRLHQSVIDAYGQALRAK